MIFLKEADLAQIAVAQFERQVNAKHLYLTEDACVFLSANEAQAWANKISSRVLTYTREKMPPLPLENQFEEAKTILPKPEAQKKIVKNRK